MKAKFILKIAPIFLLFVFDFSFQNFNPLNFSFSKCSLYLFNPTCIDFEPFATNKLLRLLLNLFTIKLVLNVFKTQIPNVKLYILGILLVYILDMFLCYSMHPLFVNWHKVLNPILYSPLAGIGLLAWFITKSKSTQND
ncbi:MAG: hypothetical protein ACEQSR_08685 [Candidatus Methylacidiphilales bacterium]